MNPTWSPPHGRQAREGSFAQILSSLISFTKYTDTIPCHCPICWSSYFNGIALDLARGKQSYLRKAKFLNLHLADTKSTNTNQNLTHLLHPSHVNCSAWVTQRRPWHRDIPIWQGIQLPADPQAQTAGTFFSQQQTKDAQNQLTNICWTYNFTDFPQAKKKQNLVKKNQNNCWWPTFHWVNYLNTAIGNNVPEMFIQNMGLLLLVLSNFTS